MNVTAADPPRVESSSLRRHRPVLLVFGCTILGAAAQILMKTGANQISHPGVTAMVASLPLMAGYALYGLSTLLLILALRDGELSLLYPVIALTYVWVTFLSLLIFRETINPWKLLGIVLIVTGVGVLGRSSAG